jgi:hypothetical protein
VTSLSRHLNVGVRFDPLRREAARRGGCIGRAKTEEKRDWSVIDDLPPQVPLSTRELDVVERWLDAIGTAKSGRHDADKACTNPTEPPGDVNRKPSAMRKERDRGKAHAN